MGGFQAVKMNIMIPKLTIVIALALLCPSYKEERKEKVLNVGLKSFRHHVDR